MESLTVSPVSTLRGEIWLPGDKSISHRAIMLGALAQGQTEIRHCLIADDTQRTIDAFRSLGIEIQASDDRLLVYGRGVHGLSAPPQELYLGNSGTTMRLLLGILAGQPFQCTLTGDPSLSQRPMRRVAEPLRRMGAQIEGREDANYAPLTIRGGRLRAIQYKLPIPSAQVKSAILLAGLYPHGVTEVIEPIPTRDHTERMLGQFGATLERRGMRIRVTGQPTLRATCVIVPGDISSATFFMVGATLVPGSKILIHDIGLNPTRSWSLDLLQAMGAQIDVVYEREDPEPRGSVLVRHAPLHGVVITEEMVPQVIDELPIVMVAATQAEGTTRIEGAGELRVKETDRIHSMITGLAAMGGSIRAEGDTVIIHGPTPLRGARVESLGDHRTAMSLAIAALIATGPTTIDHADCVRISFPTFFALLSFLSQGRVL